jgi:heme/copper-type cytochrome/quinol oxidase subunit 2
MIIFTFYFTLLTLSLTFWGSCILRLTKIDRVKKPPLMLQVIAGLAVLLVIAYGVQIYGYNLYLCLNILFILGLLGLSAKFYFLNARPWLNGPRKLTAIGQALSACDTWLAAIILALTMSMFYSAMWDSGRMEGWINNGADFYSWIYLAQYHLGMVNPDNPGLSGIFWQVDLDSLGTYFLIGLTSVARGELPVHAAPAVVVTLTVWFGSSIYYLVKKIFQLDFLSTLVVSLSLCIGSYYTYVAMTGMFGHLVFLIVFIISLGQISYSDSDNLNFKDLVKNLFFPLFALFLTYQSGYFLNACIITLALFIVTFLKLDIPLPSRIVKSFHLSLGPVLAVTALCALFMPGLAYHLFQRSLEVATQRLGWSLPLISPWLFSGLPLYISPNQFMVNSQSQETTFYAYILFIGIILAIFFIYYWVKIKANNINQNNTGKNKFYKIIYSIFLLYILSIFVYILFTVKFGNIYRVWKFSSYIILPLSFIPTALIISLTYKYITKIFLKTLFNLLSIFMFVCIFFIVKTQPIIGLSEHYFSYYSSNSILESLYSINKYYNNYNYAFDYNDISLYFLSALILSKTNNKLTFLYNPYYYYSNSSIYNDLLIDTILISNFKYNGIINSSKKPLTYKLGPLFVYDLQTIKLNGYVAANFRNLTSSWDLTSYITKYSFIVPNTMLGHDLLFSINMSIDQLLSPKCNQIELGMKDEGQQIVWHTKNLSDPTMVIPAKMSETTQLEIFARATFVKGERCSFNLDSIILEPIIYKNKTT